MVTTGASRSPMTAILYKTLPEIVNVLEGRTGGDGGVDYNHKPPPESAAPPSPLLPAKGRSDIRCFLRIVNQSVRL
jgi:hypothetical protein